MRLSIATKVFLGFVAVLICSAAVSGYGIVRLRRIGARLSLLSRPYMPLTRAVSTLEAFQKERERSTDSLLAASDPKERQNRIGLDRTYFARVVGERLAYAQQLVTQAGQGGEERDALDRIAARLGAVSARIADEDNAAAVVTSALERSQEAPADAVARLKTAERRVDQELKTLGQVLQDQMNQGVEEAEKQERAARWAVLGLSALALAVGLLVMWISQRALRPIRALTEAAQRLGRVGPESVAVPEQGGDELSLLAREFNAMAQRLAAREHELRAQGEALVRSERLAAIGRIAAQITHEIRNPLSSISLNAEELGERLREGGRATGAGELCDAIVREVDRLAAITEEYLRFARLPKPQLQRADLNDTVRDLLEFVRPELDLGRVSLQLDLWPDLPLVHADVAQLRQLLLNLIRNAREAMPAGGVLRVATRGGGGSVAVEVRDTGHGIPKDRLQRIFDPFFTTKERGTGLGLAMAQEIAQEHGGLLACESEPGRGTAFTLRLPAAAEHSEALAIAQA
jgi:two-component system, NtrC family, sensor kinase